MKKSQQQVVYIDDLAQEVTQAIEKKYDISFAPKTYKNGKRFMPVGVPKALHDSFVRRCRSSGQTADLVVPDLINDYIKKNKDKYSDSGIVYVDDFFEHIIKFTPPQLVYINIGFLTYGSFKDLCKSRGHCMVYIFSSLLVNFMNAGKVNSPPLVKNTI